jgi:hypothetical protein
MKVVFSLTHSLAFQNTFHKISKPLGCCSPGFQPFSSYLFILVFLNRSLVLGELKYQGVETIEIHVTKSVLFDCQLFLVIFGNFCFRPLEKTVK